MDIRSGTYIIMNKEKRWALDGSSRDGVDVRPLNEDETQKAQCSVSYRNLSLTYPACMSQWLLSWSKEGFWTLKSVQTGNFICVQPPHTEDGDRVKTLHTDDQSCRWSITREGMSFKYAAHTIFGGAAKH